ncbi:helix-turn-helix transcriptional regulator [uncultured Megasphaera sp.]|uniref:ArsR/SmtB family transcription factor n=1 Tax=uncultured Megasphaera sp. TaxID=165188 RepID=UPI00265B57A8|nr:metalloregulator ArsR/SmtB family transcription factor [uncultured Megasphaera sp.]
MEQKLTWKQSALRQPALIQQYIQPLADIFKVLGDPTRLRILQTLMEGERCVRDISDQIQMGQSAVSHQLRILRDARLVQFRRDGKVVYYSLADNHVFTLLSVGLEHVAE